MSALSDLLAEANAGRMSARSVARSAQAAGYSLNHDTAARYLRGDHGRPDEATLVALSKVLRIPLSRLRAAAALPADVTEPYRPPAESSRLNRRQRRAVDEIIRAMLEPLPLVDALEKSARPARSGHSGRDAAGGPAPVPLKVRSRRRPKRLGEDRPNRADRNALTGPTDCYIDVCDRLRAGPVFRPVRVASVHSVSTSTARSAGCAMSGLSIGFKPPTPSGLSARAIAKQARLDGFTLNHDTAARYLRGDHGRPDEDTLRAFASVLAVELAELRRAAELPTEETSRLPAAAGVQLG